MSNHDALQYYPTPRWLVEKAWRLFKDRKFTRVLDACAGTGAFADGLPDTRKMRQYRKVNVDCIELDVRHHATLRDKGYHVVGLDFLDFAGGSIYSHIVLNPPFSNGAAHVLKAWDSLWTGEIVAIINAETMRNLCSIDRRRLASIIHEHGSAEFINDAFKGDAVEREAQVEIALVYLNKPAECSQDWVGPVIESLSLDRSGEERFEMPRELALPASFVETQCRAFRAAVKAMREAVRAEAVATIFSQRIGKTMSSLANEGKEETAAEKSVTGEAVRNELAQRYLELKDRAWSSVLRSTETLSKLSQKIQRQAESQFETIKLLEFNESNVNGFLLGLVQSVPSMQIDMACDVFDQITRWHTDNAVLVRGWKSNDRHRTCGMRIKTTRFIIPGNTVESYARSVRWETQQLLSDFDKVFALLAGKRTPDVSLNDVFRDQFDALKRGKRVSSSFFDVRLYIGAGTIHFFPRDKGLIDRLNRWVGHHRKWMPPPDEQGAGTFWKAYAQAEAMDRDVRAAIVAEHRKRGGYASRWDDPIKGVTSQDAERSVRHRETVLTAIESVLKTRGLLDALDAEEERARLGSQQPQLRLAA